MRQHIQRTSLHASIPRAAHTVSVVQTKLRLGRVDDPHERAADQAAARTLTPTRRRAPALFGSTSSLTSAPLSAALDRDISAARGGGHPLPDGLRVHLERAYDTALDHVRIHADSRAHGLADALRARAFTAGHDIFFRRGEYRPETAAGHRLIAHEAAHAVQQDAGTVIVRRHHGDPPPPQQVIPVGSVLTHGTRVAQFAVGGVPQALPMPPAWFAIGSRFAAHAGSRRGGAATHLHNYDVQAPVNLMRFADFTELAHELATFGYTNSTHNDVPAANALLANHQWLHGYCLDADLVRGEPEYILFAAGMANLTPSFQAELTNVESPRLSDDMDLGRRRRLVGTGGGTVHTGYPNDLSRFRTIGDVPGGGPGSQEAPF